MPVTAVTELHLDCSLLLFAENEEGQLAASFSGLICWLLASNHRTQQIMPGICQALNINSCHTFNREWKNLFWPSRRSYMILYTCTTGKNWDTYGKWNGRKCNRELPLAAVTASTLPGVWLKILESACLCSRSFARLVVTDEFFPKGVWWGWDLCFGADMSSLVMHDSLLSSVNRGQRSC